ncbi:MAG: hypothetical protein AAF569_02810 [Pseudomonadota bacterium]
MTDKKPLLSVPDKVDKRAEALRANLKRRKEAAQGKDNTKKEKE